MEAYARECNAYPGRVCRVDDDGWCRHDYGRRDPHVTPGSTTRYCASLGCLEYPVKLCYRCWSWLCFNCSGDHRKMRLFRDNLRARGPLVHA